MNTTPAVSQRDPQLDLHNVALDGPLKDMAQAWAIAKILAMSSMVPQALRGSPQNCLITMMLGQELDLTWTQATRGIYVLPNGTPGLRGQLLLALIRKAGHRYTFDRTDDTCTCTITRKDEDFKVTYEGTFNLEDAKAAGLVTEKDGKLFARSNSGQPLPWQQYRRDMLQWRSVARAASIGAPEVIYGFDIAGIGDGAEGAVAPGPVPPGGATGPGQVYTAEVVDDAKAKLSELDEQMGGNGHAAQAERELSTRREDARRVHPTADYDAGPAVGPATVTTTTGGAVNRTPPNTPPPPPGYDDLDQLLKRSGFHGTAQAELVSDLIHRNVEGLADLSKGEVLIAHDVVSKAIRGASTVGARRAALLQLAAAERDAMESATTDGGLWEDEN